LNSPDILIEPPKLAAEHATDHLLPPTILSIDLVQLPENQGGVAHVTAWDAVDGTIIDTINIAAQDYEALTTHAITLHADIANSAGLHTTQDFHIAITNVNEVGFQTPAFWNGSPDAVVNGSDVTLNSLHTGAYDTSGNGIVGVGFTSSDGQAFTWSLTRGAEHFRFVENSLVATHDLTPGDYFARIEVRGAGEDVAHHDLNLHVT
jgi:hypothetical protein